MLNINNMLLLKALCNDLNQQINIDSFDRFSTIFNISDNIFSGDGGAYKKRMKEI